MNSIAVIHRLDQPPLLASLTNLFASPERMTFELKDLEGKTMDRVDRLETAAK